METLNVLGCSLVGVDGEGLGGDMFSGGATFSGVVDGVVVFS
jgi:hypothetical protein